MTDQLLDLEQACARLATSPATFRRWLRQYRVQPAVVGRGPGGKNRYRASDIDRLATQVGNHEQPVIDLEQPEQPVIDQVNAQDIAVIDLEQGVSNQAVALAAITALVKRAEDAEARERALLARALAAEWEAARLRPLTAPPDPPAAPRRRWWGRR